LVIPREEWKLLLRRIEEENGVNADSFLEPVRDRIETLWEVGWGTIAAENRDRIRFLFAAGAEASERYNKPEYLFAEGECDKLPPLFAERDRSEEGECTMAGFLSQWLQFYGPVPFDFPAEALTGADRGTNTGGESESREEKQVLPSEGNNAREEAVERLDDDRSTALIWEAIAQGIRECIEDEVIIGGRFTPSKRDKDSETEICDRKNLEILLRMRRLRQQPEIQSMPVERLPMFLAQFQGIIETADRYRQALPTSEEAPLDTVTIEEPSQYSRADSYDAPSDTNRNAVKKEGPSPYSRDKPEEASQATSRDELLQSLHSTKFQARIEQLFGFPAAAAVWEADILPARMKPYHQRWMDAAFLEHGLIWFGCGMQKISVCFAEDLELFVDPARRDLQKSTEENLEGEKAEEEKAAAREEATAERGKTAEKEKTGSNAINKSYRPEGVPAPEVRETLSGIVSSNYTYPETADAVITMLKNAGGKMDFSSIAHTVRKPRNEIARSLWELAWNTRITNDSFSSLRKGIAQKFRTDDAPDASQSRRFRSSRSMRNRWVKTLPLAGNWYVLDIDDEQMDPLEGEELNKDRVRQLLHRYGNLFRELLLQGLPDLSWSSLFRSLRLMELSGEITTGRFFEGVPGLQFCSLEARRVLENWAPGEHASGGFSEKLEENVISRQCCAHSHRGAKLTSGTDGEIESIRDAQVYWINAVDPASLCGRKIEQLQDDLPARIPSNHLVYKNHMLLMVSKQLGKELRFFIPPTDSAILLCKELFQHLVTRPVHPVAVIKTERINGTPALESPYADMLLQIGFSRDYKDLRFRKQY
jgi:hypothetical protein